MCIEHYAELEAMLFDKHLVGLEHEHSLLQKRLHPSQDSSNRQSAEPYLCALKQEVCVFSFVSSVELIASHCDHWCLLVRLAYDPGLAELTAIPEFYKGFRVRLDNPQYDAIGGRIIYGQVVVDDAVDLGGPM